MRDLQRLRELLRPKNSAAARRAGDAIRNSIRLLGQQPHIGRPVEDMSIEYREWLIDFGDSGYVALYRIDQGEIVILAARHQREVGY